MSKLALVIKSRTQPGKRNEVFQLFMQHLAPRAENGSDQEVIAWCADERDPDVFYLFEIYRDQEALQANSQAQWFGQFVAAVSPLMAEPGEVAVATPLWMKVAR